MKLIRLSLCILLFCVTWSCSTSDENNIEVGLDSASEVVYDARCQTDTVRFTVSGHWRATVSDEWITLLQTEGNGSGVIPLYIQQNDSEQTRRATLTVQLEDERQLTVSFIQYVPDTNGSIIVDLPRTFGLGWGYDYSIDHADLEGLRGQVFDAAALHNDYGEDAVMVDRSTATQLYFARAESSQQLQSEIAGKFTGSVDLLVAGVKVSSEYKNQIEEQKDCLYIWCRDFRTVKCSYFSNDVDLLSDDVVRWCTTRDFRNSVRQDNAEEFVRKYGTHLITTSYLGGKLDYYFTVSQDVKTSTEQIVTTINVKLLWFKKSSTTVDEKVWTEIKRDFEGQFHVSGGGEYGKRLNEEFDKYVSKGEPLQDQTLTDQWYACFENSNTPDEDLVMVDFYVIPIWDIVEVLNPSKAQEIEDYITNKYLKK